MEDFYFPINYKNIVRDSFSGYSDPGWKLFSPTRKSSYDSDSLSVFIIAGYPVPDSITDGQ
jgi:hypothetical protein